MLQRMIILLLAFSALKANPAFDAKHLEVSLRQLGHELLQLNGDSTSRVLPLEQNGNTYILRFESDFSFEPASLVDLSRKVLSGANLPSNYIIEVSECEKEEVIYSFEIAPLEEQEIVPCLGRNQLRACYTIALSFPNLSDAHEQGPSPSSYWYYLILLPLIGFPIFFVLRKTPEEKPEYLHQIGSFTFNAASGILSFEEVSEELTAKEGDLLLLLWKHKNQAVEREVLLHQVWGDEGDYVGRTLDVFISRLRKKLKSDPELQILNVRGVGYKLIIEA